MSNELEEGLKKFVNLSKNLDTLLNLENKEREANIARLRVITSISTELQSLAMYISPDFIKDESTKQGDLKRKQHMEDLRESSICKHCKNKDLNEYDLEVRYFKEIKYRENWISYGPLCFSCIEKIHREIKDLNPKEAYKFIVGEYPDENRD